MEEKINGIKDEINLPENQSDYIKLSELQKELEEAEIGLDEAYNDWERLTEELNELLTET